MAHVPLARRVACIGSASLAMLAFAGTAWAQPSITGTEVTTFSESFSDEPTLCQDELYTTTATGRAVVHFTFFEDTGALHFHEVVHAKVVAVPLDGTGPSYTGNFRVSDSENIRAVRHGEVLVEVDTDLDRAVLHGSDGSRAFAKFHAHFTVNANGETTVQLETDRLSAPDRLRSPFGLIPRPRPCEAVLWPETAAGRASDARPPACPPANSPTNAANQLSLSSGG